MNKIEINNVLVRLKGTNKLLTALCNEPYQNINIENMQAALFRIEELLNSDVDALEKAINVD